MTMLDARCWGEEAADARNRYLPHQWRRPFKIAIHQSHIRELDGDSTDIYR